LLEFQGKSLDWTEIREKRLTSTGFLGVPQKKFNFTQPQVSTMCGMKKKVLIDYSVACSLKPKYIVSVLEFSREDVLLKSPPCVE